MVPKLVIHDIAYLDKPNIVELFITPDVAPLDLTRTAFMIPVFDDGSVMLARNQRRGIEIAGGHVENGECLLKAACREAQEELGVIVRDSVALGYLRMTLLGDVPDDYTYPAPISYQQFFAGRIERLYDYDPNDECDIPIKVWDMSELHETIRIFGRAAREAILL